MPTSHGGSGPASVPGLTEASLTQPKSGSATIILSNIRRGARGYLSNQTLITYHRRPPPARPPSTSPSPLFFPLHILGYRSPIWDSVASRP